MHDTSRVLIFFSFSAFSPTEIPTPAAAAAFQEIDRIRNVLAQSVKTEESKWEPTTETAALSFVKLLQRDIKQRID